MTEHTLVHTHTLTHTQLCSNTESQRQRLPNRLVLSGGAKRQVWTSVSASVHCCICGCVGVCVHVWLPCAHYVLAGTWGFVVIAHLDLSANLSSSTPAWLQHKHTHIDLCSMTKQNPSAIFLSFTKDWKEPGGREVMWNNQERYREAYGSDWRERANCQGHGGINAHTDLQELKCCEAATDNLLPTHFVVAVSLPSVSLWKKCHGSLNRITVGC